jgi:uncharacterized phiE125 gp8 family phage protein
VPITLIDHREDIAEPVSVSELALFCRIDHHREDPLLSSWGKAAREWTENFTRRQLITAEWLLMLDRFPSPCRHDPFSAIILPLGSLQDVETVKYLNESGVLTTMTETTDYIFDPGGDNARIAPPYGKYWPPVLSQMNAVRVEFTCGYGDPVDVPDTIKGAIKRLVAHWYEYRDPGIPAQLRASLEEELSGYVLVELP